METPSLPPAAGTDTGVLSPFIWLAGAVVVLAAMGMVYLLARRRAPASAQSPEELARLRGVYLIWMTLYLLLAIYGSLVPLKLRSLDWSSAIEQFRSIRYLQLGIGSRADWVANILLFVPLAYLATAVLTLGVRSWPVRVAAATAVAGCCAILSVAIEFTQLWFWPRTVSLNDIIAETIGGAIGAVLWLLMGTTIHGWLAAYFRPQRRRSQIDRLLEFYLVGLVIYSLLPLDLTISPAELYRKFRDGKVVFIPFTDLPWTAEFLYSKLTDIAVFIPVGMYCATAFTDDRRPVRGWLASTLLGAAVATVIEIAQLFVFAHFSSVTSVLLGAVGSGIGAALMGQFRSSMAADDRKPWTEAALRRAGAVCLALMGLYALFLVGVFCGGGVWETNPARLWERFHGFWRPPLAALYRGSEENALNDVLRKMLFFMPLGALGGAVVMGWQSRRRKRWLACAAVLLFAAGVSFSIEMLQVFLPPRPGDLAGPSHVADAGDVVLCTAGAAIGMFLTMRTLAAGNAPEENAATDTPQAAPAIDGPAHTVSKV